MKRDAAMPRLDLSVQRAIGAVNRSLAPRAEHIRSWAAAALQRDAEVTVRLVGEAEGRRLNRDYRGKDYATNVLTFVYHDTGVAAGFGSQADDAGGEEDGDGAQDGDDVPLAGDLVVCVPVVRREAAEQGKPLVAHFAHLVVHGMLHLQGYDHEEAGEAQEMERLEARVLASLGFSDPYA